MKKNNKKQLQTQEELTAHDRLLILENFRYLMEGLEECIEKAGFYPNFKNKRQFRNITVKETDFPLENAESLLRTRLVLFLALHMPDILQEEVKQELYKWVDAVEIDVNNCPEKLKHYLMEVNNAIEGKDKIIKQTREYMDEKYKNNPPSWGSVMNVFGSIQKPMDDKREEAKLYEGKTHVEVEIKSKVKGNMGQGEKVFNRITDNISNDDFNLYSQKKIRNPNYNLLTDDPSEEFLSSSFPAENSNIQIIRDVIQNPQNWKVDEIITGYSNVGKNKEEMTLIHRNARLEDYNQWTGELNFNNNPIYKKESFSNEEWTQIENAVLGVSQTSTNRTVRWDLVNKIKQRINEFKIEEVLVPNENNDYGEESWIIHNSAERKNDKNGSLVFDSNNMFKVKNLTEAEQKELGIQQLGLDQINQTQNDNNRKGGGKGSFGGYGSSIAWGSFSVISLIGLAFTKK